MLNINSMIFHFLPIKGSTLSLIILLSCLSMQISKSNRQFQFGNNFPIGKFQSIDQVQNQNSSTNINETSYNPCRTVISFVNGIYHTHSECISIADKLETIFAEEVRVFYNPSTGNWLSDAYRAGFELLYKPDDLLVAKSLALHLRKALKDVGTDGRVLHLAHSGGAILTYLAAKFHLTKEETTRIDIATFGGGRSLTRKYFHGGRIVNYYTNNDPLLMIDRRASLLSKLLNDSTIRRYFDDDTNATYHEIRDIKHNTTFVYLDCHYNNPVLDHDMHGPAYLLAFKIEAKEHHKRIQKLLTVKELSKYWSRLIRKRSAQLTGIRHFWGPNVYSPPDLNAITNWNFKDSILSLFGSRYLSFEMKNVTDVMKNNVTMWSWFQSKSSKASDIIEDISGKSGSDLLIDSSESFNDSSLPIDSMEFLKDRKETKSSIWSWLQFRKVNSSSIVIENNNDFKDGNVGASLFEDKNVNNSTLKDDHISNAMISNDNDTSNLIDKESCDSMILAKDNMKRSDDHSRNKFSMWPWFQFKKPNESGILEYKPVLKDENPVDLIFNFENVSSFILNEDNFYENITNNNSSLKSWFNGISKWNFFGTNKHILRDDGVSDGHSINADLHIIKKDESKEEINCDIADSEFDDNIDKNFSDVLGEKNDLTPTSDNVPES